MSFVREFAEFLKKYQVIGLAVAFVMGAAANRMIGALVGDIIMPFVSVIIPGGNWRSFELVLGPFRFLIGDFVAAIIDFLIVAIVVFATVKLMMREDVQKP